MAFLASSFITKLYEEAFHVLIAPPTSLRNYPHPAVTSSSLAARPILKHPQFTMVHYSQPRSERN